MSWSPLRRAPRLALLVASLSLSFVTANGCATSSATAAADEPKAAKTAPLEPVDVTASAELVEIGEQVPPDPEVVAFLAPQAKQVNARAQRVIGRLKAPLQRGKPESTLGNFVTDAMREGMGRFTGQPVDLCFTNSGGLRRDVDGGEVTEGVIVELMPFDNSIIVFEATASQLNGIIDRLAQRGDPASGLTYLRAGGKAREVKVGGKPIREGRVYRLCTNDYVFEGGGQYPFESVSNVSYTGVLLRDALIEAFERERAQGRAVAPTLDGRVKEAR